MIRRIELADTLAVQIFQRPGGSYGYYYLHKEHSEHSGDYWVTPPNMGAGSAYDTADRAEEYARVNAANEV